MFEDLAAALFPFNGDAVLVITYGRCAGHGHLSARRFERAVLDGVGGEFMKGESEPGGGMFGNVDRRTFDGDARGFRREGSKREARDLTDGCAACLGRENQLAAREERTQPSEQRVDIGLDNGLASWPRLTRDTFNHRDEVARAVLHLAENETLLLGGAFALDFVTVALDGNRRRLREKLDDCNIARRRLFRFAV